MSRKPVTVEEIAAGLRALAEEFELGYRQVPEPGQSPRTVAGVRVVPVAVHDVVCGWRVATEQDHEGPERVAACAGCGLGYLIEEAQMRRWSS